MPRKLSFAGSYKGDQRFWSYGDLPPCLGCRGCSDEGLCGGLRTVRALHNCLDFCCGKPETCGSVCPNAPAIFARRLREVGGTLDLADIPRSGPVAAVSLPDVVPILFHRGRISTPHSLEAVCLPFHRMFSLRDGSATFRDAAELRSAFNISQNTPIILTGVAKDRFVEGWWGVTYPRRRLVIRSLRALGVAMVTVPNFSLTSNEPRWTDLHAMMRIARCQWEIQNEGLPAALHVNARTEHDYDRWTEFLIARPEITHIAVEFLTGSGRSKRSRWHLEQLLALQAHVGRPLHLVVRGGTDFLGVLSRAFPNMTVLTSNAFMKTVYRHRLVPIGNSDIGAIPAPTGYGQALDDLWNDNWAFEQSWLRSQCQT